MFHCTNAVLLVTNDCTKCICNAATVTFWNWIRSSNSGETWLCSNSLHTLMAEISLDSGTHSLSHWHPQLFISKADLGAPPILCAIKKFCGFIPGQNNIQMFELKNKSCYCFIAFLKNDCEEMWNKQMRFNADCSVNLYYCKIYVWSLISY